MLVIMLLLSPALQTRCFDEGHAKSCDSWLAPMGDKAPEGALRRACAFEAPAACMLLAQRRPKWATTAQRIEFNRIGCRVYPRACEAITAIARDASLAQTVRDTAWKAAERGCRRWSETCYRLGRGYLRTRPKATRRWWTLGCRGGDVRACEELAWRLERGDGLPKDSAGARWAFERGCRAGHQALCRARLSRWQAKGNQRAIARACAQGDTLACVARDAHRCRRGRASACIAALQVPAGACVLGPAQCEEHTPFRPKHCTPYDPCAPTERALRVAIRQAFQSVGTACLEGRAHVRLTVARSGVPVRWTIGPTQARACLISHVEALRLPVADAPSDITVRVFRKGARIHIRSSVRFRRGTPISEPINGHLPLPLR